MNCKRCNKKIKKDIFKFTFYKINVFICKDCKNYIENKYTESKFKIIKI